MLSNEYKKGKTKIEEPVIVGVAHSHTGGYYQEGCGGCQYEDKSNTIKPSQDKTVEKTLYTSGSPRTGTVLKPQDFEDAKKSARVTKVENGEVWTEEELKEFDNEFAGLPLDNFLEWGRWDKVDRKLISNALNQQRLDLINEIRNYGVGGGYTALEVANILEEEFLTKLEK